jgi:hypothetical protein
MSLHEQIAARFTTDDTKILLLTLADHIEALEAKVEKLELTKAGIDNQTERKET